MKLIQIIIVGIILIYGLKLEGQTTNDTTKIEEILEVPVAQMSQEFLEDSLLISISIGVYYKSENFIRHFGELDKGKGNKPDNSTIYDIGSVTKTFVGTLIAQAEIEGKLSIEDDIRDYLEGDYSNLEFEKQPIKIKHLITHTSGLPRFLPLRIIDEFNEINADLADRISKIERSYSKLMFFDDLKNVAIDTVPGRRFSYSNVGGELASFILESVYEMPFEKLLKEKLCKTANMHSTTINLAPEQQNRFANGYGDFGNIMPPMISPLWGGSGHGKSTITDLMNYMKYHLDIENKVAQKSHSTLFDKEVIYGNPRNKMGYMWMLSTDGDFGQYINQHGGAYGAQNWIMIYPEEQLGISVITNQSGRHTAGRLYDVVDGILSEIAQHKYASDKSETEQITETLMDYIEGSTQGHPERLKKAFHPDLNLYYIRNREFRVWNGKNYIADTREGESTGETGEILSIDYENNIATAKIRISHPESEVSYIDYLMLIKANGRWIIVHKMFTQEVKK